MRIDKLSALTVFALFVALAAAPSAADDEMLRKIQDRIEIEELIVRYVTALDTLDADGYAGVFTEDAQFDVSGTSYSGRAEIRAIVTGLQESRARNEAAGRPSPALYHVMSNTSIEILDENNARHTSYAQTVRAGEDGRYVVGFMGKYEDQLVKLDGRWLIRSRKLIPFEQ